MKAEYVLTCAFVDATCMYVECDWIVCELYVECDLIACNFVDTAGLKWCIWIVNVV